MLMIASVAIHGTASSVACGSSGSEKRTKP